MEKLTYFQDEEIVFDIFKVFIHFKVITQPTGVNLFFSSSPSYFLPFFITIGALSTISLASFNPKFIISLSTLITLIF